MSADSGDAERFEAQRKALSALMARFTADRDSLITSIQECQEQLGVIATRLDAGQVSSSPQLDEVKRLIEQMQLDQRRAEPGLTGDAEIQELIVRLGADREAQAAAIRKCEEQLDVLTARVEASQSDSVPQLDALRQEIERQQNEQKDAVAEARAAAQDALARAADALGRIDALANAAPSDTRIDEIATQVAADRQAFDRALHECQAQLDAVTARLERPAAPLGPTSEEVRQIFEDRLHEHHSAVTEARAAAAEALARANEAAHRVDTLGAAAAGGQEGLATLASEVHVAREQLSGALGECRQQLQHLAQRLDTAEAARSALLDATPHQVEDASQGNAGAHAAAEKALARAVETLQQIEAAQREQQRAHAQACAAADEALRNAQEVCGRLDEVAAAHTTHHDNIEALATSLVAERTAMESTLAECQGQLRTLAADLETVRSRDAAALADVRRLVEELRKRQQQGEHTARSAADRAAAQAAEALQHVQQLRRAQRQGDEATQGAAQAALMRADEACSRIDELMALQQQRHITVDELAVRLTSEQGVLRAALRDYYEQLGVLRTQLERRHASAPDVDALRKRIEVLEELDDERTREARAMADSAVARVGDAIRQIDDLVASQQAQHGDGGVLSEQLAAERETIRAALQEYDQQLHVLAGRLDAQESLMVSHGDVLHRVEQIAERQQRSDVASDLAATQAATALQRTEELAAADEAQRRATTDTQADVTQALARVDSALERIEAVAAAQHGHGAQVDEIQTRLVEDRDAVNEALRAYQQQLQTLAEQTAERQQRSDAASDLAATQAATALQRTEELAAADEAQRRATTDTQGAVRQALARVDGALERIETIAAAQHGQGTQVAEIQTRLVGDRDTVNEALRTYQQRLQTLAAQLEQTQLQTAPQLQELQRLVEQAQADQRSVDGDARALVDQALTRASEASSRIDALEAGQQRTAADLRAAAEQSLERATEALRRIDEISATQHAHQTDAGELASRLTTDLETAGQALRAFEQQLGALATRLEASQDSITPQLEDLKKRVEQVRAELQPTMAHASDNAGVALVRVGEALERIEQLAATQRDHEESVRAAASRATDDLDAIQTTLHGYQEQVSALATRMEANEAVLAPRLTGLQQLVEQLQVTHDASQSQAKTAAAEALARAGDALRQIEQLTATQRDHEQAAAVTALRAESDRDAVSAALQRYQGHLNALAARLESGEVGIAPQLAELHQLVAQLGGTQQTALSHATSTADQALARAAEALQRLEDVSAAQQGQQAIVRDVASRLVRDQEALHAAVGKYHEQLSALTTRVESSHTSIAPQLHGLQQLVETIREERQSGGSHARAAAEDALTRANEAVRRLEELTASHQGHHEIVQDLAARMAQDRDVGTSALRQYQHELQTLTARWDDDRSQAAQRLDALQRRLDDLHDAEATTSRRVQHAAEEATARANETLHRLEKTVETHEGRQTTAEALLARVVADRDALDGTLRECRQQLDTLTGRLDAHQRTLPTQLSELRAELEQTHVALGRATADALNAAQETSARVAEALRRIEQVVAEQQAERGRVDAVTTRVETERGVLGDAIGECQRQIAALAAELHTTATASLPQVDALHRTIEQVQLDQRLSNSQTRAAADQAATRSTEALRCIEELTAAHRSRDEATSAHLTRFAAERDGLTAALRESEQQIAAITGRLEQMQLDVRLATAQTRAAADEGLNQASDASRCVEELTNALRSRDETLAQLTARMGADRDFFTRTLETERQRVGTATATLEQRVTDTAQQLAGARQVIDELVGDRSRAAADREVAQHALSRADGAWQRLDELAAAREADRATASEIQLLGAQADRFAAGLSRLDARVEQLARGASVRAVETSDEPLVSAIDDRRPSFTARHRLWPAFAAAALILAALGTVALVAPGDRALWRDLGRHLPGRRTRSAVERTELSLATPTDAFGRGLTALQHGDLASAEQAFAEVVAAQPDAVEARNNLAAVLVEEQRYADAAEQLRAALKLRPDYQRARTNLEVVERLLASRQAAPPDGAPAKAPAERVEPRGTQRESQPTGPGAGSVPAPANPAPGAATEPSRWTGTPVANEGTGRGCDSGNGNSCTAVTATPERARVARRSHRRRLVDLEPPADFAVDLP